MGELGACTLSTLSPRIQGRPICGGRPRSVLFSGKWKKSTEYGANDKIQLPENLSVFGVWSFNKFLALKNAKIYLRT